MTRRSFNPYANAGNTSEFTPAVESSQKGSILLVHGILVRGYYMSFYVKHFSQSGYDVYNYDYPSSQSDTYAHGLNLAKEIERIVSLLPADEPLHIVTHSMGGILLRQALPNTPSPILERLGNIVMMAPPNRGSHWSNVLRHIPGVGQLNRSVLDLCDLPTSPLRNIPAFPLTKKIGIVVGTYDTKVRPEQTRLPDANCEYLEIPYTHGAMSFSKNIFKKVRYFIEHQTFNENEKND